MMLDKEFHELINAADADDTLTALIIVQRGDGRWNYRFATKVRQLELIGLLDAVKSSILAMMEK